VCLSLDIPHQRYIFLFSVTAVETLKEEIKSILFKDPVRNAQ
jgi:hypothetical protein